MNQSQKKEDEVIKNLTQKIENLEKQVRLNEHYKQSFLDEVRRNRELLRQLEIKRKVIRIEGVIKDELTNYLLEILDVIDTPEGLFIKAFLPDLEQNKLTDWKFDQIWETLKNLGTDNAKKINSIAWIIQQKSIPEVKNNL